MDLGVWVRDGRYRGLLQLIDQLSPASRFYQARQNDPDYAEQVAALDQPADPPKWRPQLRDFDLQAQLTHQLLDAVLALHRSVEADRTKTRPRKGKPLLLPESEVDRAIQRRDDAEVDDIFRRLVPHQFTT